VKDTNLYTQTPLYDIADTPQPSTDIAIPTDFNKLVLVSTLDAGAGLPDGEREFLERFLRQGLKMELGQTLVLPYQGKSVPFRLLAEQYGARYILLFGEDTWGGLPHITFSKNTSFSIFGAQVFTALPIATIDQSATEKKAFWAELRLMFGV
jgi:hypothetical protein